MAVSRFVSNSRFELWSLIFGSNRIAFGFEDEILTQAMIYVEIFYLIEIILQFFTTYKDSEHFENVYTMRLIAKEYIINGSFIFHVLAFIPWQLIISYKYHGDESTYNDPDLYAEYNNNVMRI